MDDPAPAPTDRSGGPRRDPEAAAEHEARELTEVVERLVSRFPDISEDRIRAVVRDAHQRFDGNPIRDFVPVFVERAARGTLGAQPPG